MKQFKEEKKDDIEAALMKHFAKRVLNGASQYFVVANNGGARFVSTSNSVLATNAKKGKGTAHGAAGNVSNRRKFREGFGFARIQSNYDMPSIEPKPHPEFLDPAKTLSLIGAPMVAGQRKAGVDQGPKQLRSVGLVSNLKGLGWKVDDYGDLSFENLPLVTAQDEMKAAAAADEDGEASKYKFIPGTIPRNCEIVGRASEKIFNSASHAHARKSFVLTLGGDHSIGAATVLASLAQRPETGVIWVDAHADINTPHTSNTGNMHGMPVAIAMGLVEYREKLPGFEWLKDKPTLSPRNLVYIGLRDLDAGEKKFIRDLGIKAFTMFEVDRYGIGEVMKRALNHLRLPNGDLRPLHLSYDIDACDPVFAPSTGTLVRGGITFRESNYIAESVAQTGKLGSMDLVEVNAALSPKTLEEAPDDDITVQLGAALVSSALGSRIL